MEQRLGVVEKMEVEHWLLLMGKTLTNYYMCTVIYIDYIMSNNKNSWCLYSTYAYVVLILLFLSGL